MIELIQLAKSGGYAKIDSLLQEMLLGSTSYTLPPRPNMAGIPITDGSVDAQQHQHAQQAAQWNNYAREFESLSLSTYRNEGRVHNEPAGHSNGMMSESGTNGAAAAAAANSISSSSMYCSQPTAGLNNQVSGPIALSDDSETPISSPEDAYKIAALNNNNNNNQSGPFKREIMDSSATY